MKIAHWGRMMRLKAVKCRKTRKKVDSVPWFLLLFIPSIRSNYVQMRQKMNYRLVRQFSINMVVMYLGFL